METRLENIRKRVRDLQVYHSHFPSSLVQVTAGVEEFTTVGKRTYVELSTSSKFTSTIPFPKYHLWWQLTDPHQEYELCFPYSEEWRPEMYTLICTPTLPGPYQLKITLRDTDIPGSPFTVHVLPSPEKRGELQYTIIRGINKPWGVAVSKSGEVV